MFEYQNRHLSGWGRLETVETAAYAPGDDEELRSNVTGFTGDSLIGYGQGRSYGDQALNSGGSTILSVNRQRILDFDGSSGEVTCEAGVTLMQLMQTFLPKGYIPFVSPGTGFVTVGGAIANDVHGKNHDSHGSFGNHVTWIDLMTPSGEVTRISNSVRPTWFAATLGGSGLTGIIVRARLRLMPIKSNAISVREQRTENLEVTMARLTELRESATYLVAWIDGLSRGSKLGRGIVESAELSNESVPEPTPGKLNLSFNFPSFALNPLSISSFNALYYHRVPQAGRQRQMAVRKFLYPLDTLNNWNKMYGRRGFFQFQCVLPDETSARGMKKLLETVSRHHAASFLAVLKTLGGNGSGMLSFPMRGFTLALDFPNRGGVRKLLDELEAITLDHCGRIYLAKDATLSPENFHRMYPRLDEFRDVLAELDPKQRMQSNMSRRLKIH